MESNAVALGGHLATLNDPAEQDWVYSTFARLGSFWIGLNDLGTEGTFVWASGEAVTYTNWAGGYPRVQASYDGVYVDPNDARWRIIPRATGCAGDRSGGAECADQQRPGIYGNTCWTSTCRTRCRRR